MRQFFALLFGVVLTAAVQGAPQMLLETPLESPEGTYAANVEWDAAGFIGRIRMLAYTNSERPSAVAELPQIKPAPANLTWVSEDWFACESFVAESGAAFCYMHVPRSRAYMIEIFAPEKEGDWLISYTTNDRVSSDSIQTVTRGHSSLFPILLRDLPKNGLGYLSPDFAILLGDAIDSFSEWRRKQGFKTLKPISAMAEEETLGRLLIASIDSQAELVYFPGGTTSTREMLALTQRKALPESVQGLINGIDPPRLSVEWAGLDGTFSVFAAWEDQPTSRTEVVAGKFEGVKDSKYTGPGVTQLVMSTTADKVTITESAKSKGDSTAKAAPKATAKKPAAKKTPAKTSSSKKSSTSKKKPSRSN